MPFVPRSYLFVPGNRPERFAKACESGADMVILDLEDAVPLPEKAAAREAVAAWLRPEHRVCLRINAVQTEWFRDDCALLARPGIATVMLPKAETPDDIAAAASAGKPVLALIESAIGMDNAKVVARAPGVGRLVFGSVDFQLDLGISGEGEELLVFRSALVLASRLAGLPAPVDGVSTVISDMEALAADAARARRLGFGAKACIHPKQVAAVNAAFSPSAEELAWAQRVLDAAAKAGGAAVAVDGKMVDRPVILRAQALVEQARAYAGG